MRTVSSSRTGSPALAWRHEPWATLTTDELYRIMVVRQRVFVVEQNCPYLDPDGLDPQASHLWCDDEAGTAALAYLRIFAPGVRHDEASFGRVVTAPEARRTGLGRALMREAIERLEAAHGPTPVKIGAQKYLEEFYGSFGFVRISDDYLEDGIPHLMMVRR